MIYNNPFSILSEIIPAISYARIFNCYGFALVVLGTLVDIIHKKNVKYFFENAKKAKKSATRKYLLQEKTSIIIKHCL